jgi:predicted secreted protein
MSKMLFIDAGMLAVVSLLSACAANPPPAGTTRRITENDAGNLVELRAGDQLEILLPGNQSTGFQWEVESVDESILKLSGEPAFTPGSANLGAPGTFLLVFQANKPGRTELGLVYRQPFEKNAPPKNTFQVTVAVK